jgi:hypothetical protein
MYKSKKLCFLWHKRNSTYLSNLQHFICCFIYEITITFTCDGTFIECHYILKEKDKFHEKNKVSGIKINWSLSMIKFNKQIDLEINPYTFLHHESIKYYIYAVHSEWNILQQPHWEIWTIRTFLLSIYINTFSVCHNYMFLTDPQQCIIVFSFTELIIMWL